MAMPLIQQAETLPQEEAQPVTPKPMEATAVQPGAGLPVQKASKDPMDDRSAGPIDSPMPKPAPVPSYGDTPVPKPTPMIGGDIPVPKPTVGVGGAGTAPAAPSVTPGGGGGSFNWQSSLAQTDRNAVTRSVGDNELTSRQLERLIDANGRYIQGRRLSAREGAASGGMLLSTMASGAAERAAIDAAAPIAQADASVYANTASENMRAQNEDAMSDQLGGRSLLSQSESQAFQGSENQANRVFQREEAGADRQFRREEAGTERDWRSIEAGRDRDQQFLMQERGFSFQDAQAAVERGWRSSEAEIERGFNAGQNEESRRSQRIAEYNNIMAGREAQLSQQLASIFSNTNLKPAEQQAAAENARAIFTSTTASFNAAFAQGVPEIFMRPYQMQTPPPGTQPTTPAPPPGGGGGGIPAGGTPVPGSSTLYRDQNGIIRQIVQAAGG